MVIATDSGQIIVDTKENLFARLVSLAENQSLRAPAARPFVWAFTGGSTPQDFYRWAAAGNKLSHALQSRAAYTVSDERHVPLTDAQSNFGYADRLLLAPLNTAPARKLPWPVELAPAEAAQRYTRPMTDLVGPHAAYDLCCVGMGDDAHTLSIFPGSPLLNTDHGQRFAAVEVPGKGMRLTLTPTGLARCGHIVVMALGAAKAPVLKRVLRGPLNLAENPIQLLRAHAARVTWLVDAAAASEL